MKRSLYVLTLAALAIGLAGCGSYKGGHQVNVNPNPLEVHGDSIKYTVKASLPPKAQSGFAKGMTFDASLELRGGSDAAGKYEAGKVRINYADVPNIDVNGASRSFSFSRPYQDAMNGSTMVGKPSVSKNGKVLAVKGLVEMPNLASCCITTSRLLDPSVVAANAAGAGSARERGTSFKLMPYSYQQKTTVTQEAKFQFPKDVFKIQATQYKKTDIVAIGEFLKKKLEQSAVNIQGFASPEGRYARNQFLSINRSREVQKWLAEQLKKDGYTNYLDSSYFRITTTSEDWEGFKANLDQTKYSEDIKRQIIEIVSAGLDEDEKERKIMGLVGGANRVENILAPLRRATILMEAASVVRNDAALNDMVSRYVAGSLSGDELARTLTQEEFLYTVSITTDPAAKQKLMNEYTKAYPNDARGYNNLGVYYMMTEDKDKAADAFMKANEKKPNDPVILNNLARVQMMRGNMADAATYSNAANNITPSPLANYVNGVNAAKTGKYSQAAQYFEKASGEPGAKYNAGIAKLLMNDLAGAKSDLDAATKEDPNNANAFYGLGIVGARAGDTNLMLMNLKSAVQKKSELSDKAAKDLEFKQYFSSAEFKAAIAK